MNVQGGAEPGQVRVTIRFYDPDCDAAPHYETFEVERQPRMRVLDALIAVHEEAGRALGFEWYCGVRKCGACGVKVNGQPQLSCWEPVQDVMVIEPLDKFPVVRDLIVDRGRYEDDKKHLNAYLDRAGAYPGFPEPVTSQDVADSEAMARCIECSLCTSACPQYGDGFVGPAALVQLARVALDPVDRGGRATVARDIGGIAHCISCGRCSDICPSSVPVLDTAIRFLNDGKLPNGNL